MCCFDIHFLSDVISSIGPKISDFDTYSRHFVYLSVRVSVRPSVHIFRNKTLKL